MGQGFNERNLVAKAHATKQKMFEVFASSAKLSGYCTDAAYFCPLCDRRFDSPEGLTFDHIPFAALGARSLRILACRQCNNDSGKAQGQLAQARRIHLINGPGPTADYRFHLTLAGITVVAHVRKTASGKLELRIDEHNNPSVAQQFVSEFAKFSDEQQVNMQVTSLIQLDHAAIRWAIARDSFLLLFYHWGYWLARQHWVKEFRALMLPGLKAAGQLPASSVIDISSYIHTVQPWRGEFLTVKTPDGESFWLVPLVDGRATAFPMDGDGKSCIALWDKIAMALSSRSPLHAVRRAAIDREVKNANLWVVIDMHESEGDGKPWIVFAPADKYDTDKKE